MGQCKKIFTWGGVKDYDGRTWLYVENNEVYLREKTEQTHMWYLKIISHMHIFFIRRHENEIHIKS